MTHFKLTCSTKASDIIPVNKYVSQKTGITVIIAENEGPSVSGFFCLVTEPEGGEGLSNALDRMILLGSEKYPNAGISNLLAYGSYAWTDGGRTCIYLSTIGDAGMLTLLPIYLDHIFNPALTEQSFITEVHHINGDGEDAGAMYCDRKDYEHSAGNRCTRRMLRAMYPGPSSSYSATGGGILEDLRTSTTNAQVIDFHKKYYRPENLTIIMSGPIAADDVFRALAAAEDEVVAKREKEPLDEWVKPWQTLPPPPSYEEITEQFPAVTEDNGQVLLAWRGPQLTEPSSVKEMTALAVLLRYVFDTDAAPLRRCLVCREDPLAGNVYFHLNNNVSALIEVWIDDVPVAKLEAAKVEAQRGLCALRTGDEAIDMERMRRLLRVELRECIHYSLEMSPHWELADRCMEAMLYSEDDQNFALRLNPQLLVPELLDEGAEYWRALLQRYLSEEMLVVLAAPSIELRAKLEEEEKSRIEAQKAALGESGLAEKAKQLKDAMEFNARPRPPEMIASVSNPSSGSLSFRRICTWSSDTENCPHFDLKEVPLYTRVHSLKTNFVYVNIVLDLSSLAQETRKWVLLLLNSLSALPVRRGAGLVPHEEVAAATERLTAMFSHFVGLGRDWTLFHGGFPEYQQVHARCEPTDYEEVVDHLYEMLYAAEFTKDRLLALAQKVQNEVQDERRQGHVLVNDILRDSVYSTDSNQHWCTVLRQERFLQQLVESLSAGGEDADDVVLEANQHLKRFTRKAWLQLAADFDRFTLSTEPWKKFARENDTTPPKVILHKDMDSLSGWEGSLVVGVSGLDTAYLVQSSPGPREYDVETFAPLMVALNYFTHPEGPMWRLINDSGLSVSFHIEPQLSEARLRFYLYHTDEPAATYAKAKEILEEYLSSGKFDEELFKSARRAALADVASNLSCAADVVGQELGNYVLRLGDNYDQSLARAIASVSIEAAGAAAARWLPTLFDTARCRLALVCPPSKVAHVQQAFDKINVKLEAFETVESLYFND